MKINQQRFQQQNPNVKLEYFDELGSTNDYAKKSLINFNTDGLVVANRQTSGRGTHGRVFHSPETGMYMSIYFPITNPQINPGRLTANVATSIVRILRKRFKKDIKIKWINDLYLDSKKVAGILCELVTKDQNQLVGVVIGAGLDLVTNEYPSNMLREAGNITESITTDEATDLVSEITQVILKKRQTILSDVIDPLYEQLMFLIGMQVTIDQTNNLLYGRVSGVNSDNILMLQDGSKEYPVMFGRVIDWKA